MPVIELKSIIKAPREICFDLSINIDLHMKTMEQTNEKAIAGRINGQITLGETVTWRARHFGLNFTMTSLITEWSRPHHFTDKMTKGPFKYFSHKHIFEPSTEGTLMTDICDFSSPLGLLGSLVDEIILESYLRKLLIKRNEFIKITAEHTHSKFKL